MAITVSCQTCRESFGAKDPSEGITLERNIRWRIVRKCEETWPFGANLKGSFSFKFATMGAKISKNKQKRVFGYPKFGKSGQTWTKVDLRFPKVDLYVPRQKASPDKKKRTFLGTSPGKMRPHANCVPTRTYQI